MKYISIEIQSETKIYDRLSYGTDKVVMNKVGYVNRIDALRDDKLIDVIHQFNDIKRLLGSCAWEKGRLIDNGADLHDSIVYAEVCRIRTQDLIDYCNRDNSVAEFKY